VQQPEIVKEVKPADGQKAVVQEKKAVNENEVKEEEEDDDE